MRMSFAFILWAIMAGFIACTQPGEETAARRSLLAIDTTFLAGAPDSLRAPLLAQAYCGSCHVYPPPDLLPRQVWISEVLPQMGLRMGVPIKGKNPYAGLTTEEILRVAGAGVYPSQPRILPAQWNALSFYYAEKAPESLPMVSPPPDTLAGLFESSTLKTGEQVPGLTTFLHVASDSQEVWLGDWDGFVYRWRQENHFSDTLLAPSAPTDFAVVGATRYVLCSGYFSPNDRFSGQLVAYEPGSSQGTVVLDSLPRPVNMRWEDLNGDKEKDVVICGFGHHLGYLGWYDLSGEVPAFHLLSDAPGAIRVEAGDYDQDGDIDLAALMTQGEEGIDLYWNQGKGTFERQRILDFPPVWGSSYFTLIDWNQDGHLDILYTHGDNADYSQVLKPYHGIRIFLNQGDFRMKEVYFYPLPGAYKAVAEDFDQDGDLDIAAISFFADYLRHPIQGAVYLAQQGKGGFDFKPYLLPGSGTGRWLLIEPGDFDADGDQDLILGAFAFANSPLSDSLRKAWSLSGTGAMVLWNGK